MRGVSFLISQIITQSRLFCFQELPAKISCFLGTKELAAENLYEGAVFCFVKMEGKGGGFNKLDGGVTE